MTTEDDNCLGNFGLYDMVHSLKWVRDNIADFNGNPNNVTVFGESSGSTSVALLTLTQEAAGIVK